MAKFLAELKRRQMFRVAAAYAVVAWLILQVVNNVAPALRLPEWAATLVLVLLLVGLPITLLAAWARELAPDGGATVRLGASRLDYVLIGALAVVIALVSYQQLAPSPGAGTLQQQAGVTSGAPGAAGISLAVLPFVNLSGDSSQEFFSDGMTEEITAALAKVSGLRVVGRTSAFQFKGENKDLRAIGQALSATHLIEGSVRKEGNQLRITAQLIKAEDGTHVWAESYDRELKGVFAVQEEIAQAIATSLQVPLGLQQGETLISNRTGDTDSYEDYLRAKALVRARGINTLTEAAGLLEQVVARDPSYAPAWALLGQAYALAPSFSSFWVPGTVSRREEFRREANDALMKAEAAAQRAIALDARNADAHAALGDVSAFRGRFLESEDFFKRALALDPLNPDALNAYSRSVAELGRVQDAGAIRQQLRALEPLVPVFNAITARYLWVGGQSEAALAMANALPTDYPLRTMEIAWINASMGRYREAADALSMIPAGLSEPDLGATIVQLLRTAPTASRVDVPYLGYLSFIHLYTGAPERSLEMAELHAEVGYNLMIVNASLWHPSYAAVRKTDRFKELMRKVGLFDYWRARGWPEFCHPTTSDDFECN